MFEKLLQLISDILGGTTTPTVLAPVTDLKRVDANVKVTWTLSESKNITGQKIIVVAHGQEIINKMLKPETPAFSFKVAKGSDIKVSIMPFDGIEMGEATVLEFVA